MAAPLRSSACDAAVGVDGDRLWSYVPAARARAQGRSGGAGLALECAVRRPLGPPVQHEGGGEQGERDTDDQEVQRQRPTSRSRCPRRQRTHQGGEQHPPADRGVDVLDGGEDLSDLGDPAGLLRVSAVSLASACSCVGGWLAVGAPVLGAQDTARAVASARAPGTRPPGGRGRRRPARGAAGARGSGGPTCFIAVAHRRPAR